MSELPSLFVYPFLLKKIFAFFIQEDHELYKKKLEEMILLQKKCLAGIAHQRYRLKKMAETAKYVIQKQIFESEGIEKNSCCSSLRRTDIHVHTRFSCPFSTFGNRSTFVSILFAVKMDAIGNEYS